METEELWWEKNRYLYGREIGGGTWICVAEMITTWRIMLCDTTSVFEYWCYPITEFDLVQVLVFAVRFSGVGDPHEGWVKHFPSGRRPRDPHELQYDR